MRRLIQQMQRMAPHLTLATIEGEEGTGRTLAARALHAAGPAPEGPFVPCLATQFFSAKHADCGRTSKGATSPILTGSTWSRTAPRSAHGGMLFLDRVHQLSPGQQEVARRLPALVRRPPLSRPAFAPRRRQPPRSSPAAKTPCPRRSSSPPRSRCEIPAVSPGFREDLASRLCSVRFHLPPLTQRREDIPLLAQVFIQRFARTYGKPVRGLGPGTIAPLLRHPWPGNVRELEETITAAALETESQWIRPIDLPPLTAVPPATVSPNGSCEANAEDDFNLDHAIRNHVTRVLARTRGNKLRAAQLLGISRSTLYRILAAQPGATQSPAQRQALKQTWSPESLIVKYSVRFIDCFSEWRRNPGSGPAS